MRQRGFTLLELSVAAGLFLMLLGICLRLFWPGFRFVLLGGARAELQQRATLVTQRLVEDLQSTAACGVSLGEGVVAVQPIAEVTPDPRTIYAAQLIGWLRRGQRLDRLFWPAPALALNTDLPVRLDAAGLAALVATAGTGQRSLSIDGVREFSVASAAPGDDIESPLTLSLSVERLYASRSERFSLTRSVVLRNGF